MPIDGYDFYKPLRNHLRPLEVLQSFGVVRAYMQYLQYGVKLPEDIELPAQFRGDRANLRTALPEWQLDVLAREVILNAAELPPADTRETLQRWAVFAGAMNKVKQLEDDLVDLYPQGHGLHELHRIAHRQFVWQRPPRDVWFGRYWKIFGAPQLDAIIQRVLGLTAKDLYGLGLALSGVYFGQFALYEPPDIEIPGLTPEKLERFVAHFGADLATLRKRQQAVQELSANYAYLPNLLRYYPLVRARLRGRPALIAPIPTFLIWRFTEGVYYEILHEPDFSEPYGEAVQRYVGEVVARAGGALQLYPEAEYNVGNARKDTVDWIVEDPSALLFVESKAKRLLLAAKIEVRSNETFETELDKLAGFIVQVYRTIADYLAGYYPQRTPQPAKRIFPLVVVLEEWFLFGPVIIPALDQRVAAGLDAAELPRAWLGEMPYSTCSMAEFETLMQIIAMRSIADVMSRRTDDADRRQWLFDGFLRQEFAEEHRKSGNLFPEVLDDLTRAFGAG